jgi:hypothetical protein
VIAGVFLGKPTGMAFGVGIPNDGEYWNCQVAAGFHSQII